MEERQGCFCSYCGLTLEACILEEIIREDEFDRCIHFLRPDADANYHRALSQFLSSQPMLHRIRKSSQMCAVLLAVLMLVSCGQKQPASPRRIAAGWEILAPIPDPVGFGGMFAGVLDGRLIAGGGSKFPEKPLWAQGSKVYSDTIYSLGGTDETWKRLNARLPEKCGHSAFAASLDAIFLIGGLTADGFSKSCHALRLAEGNVVIGKLPDFPMPVCYASAAVIGNRLIVVGGQHSPSDKRASGQTWTLEIGKNGAAWERGADMPGRGVYVAASGADGVCMYVFGGMAFDSEGRPSPSKAVCRYDAGKNAWERLPDLSEPRVGAASPCPRLPNGDFMIIGGYAELYSGAQREHPGFSAQTLLYNPESRRCVPGPMLPCSPASDRDLTTDSAPNPMLAAPCAMWMGRAVCVGGEVRISTRTPTVLAWPIEKK